MLSCKTFLSLNGQSPVECLPITENNTVSLCKTGVTLRDSAIASLQLDEHNELVVVRLTETPVTLERAGRRIALRMDKPIRICEKDILWIGETSIEMVKSTFVISKPAPKSALIQTAKKVIAASAAVFSMVAFAACDEDGCDNGQQKCKKDGVYICANGSWNLLEKCSSDQICIESSNTSAYCEMAVHPGEPIEECTPGEMKCDDNNVYKCDDGLWKLEEECSYGTCYQKSNTSAVCQFELAGEAPYDPNDPYYVPQCSSDEMKCKDNNVYKCDDGHWKLQEKCQSGAVCFEESNTSAFCEMAPLAGDMPIDICESDAMKCEDNNAYKCVDGIWTLEEECIKDAVCIEVSNTSAFCDMGPTTGVLPPQECEPKAMKCEDNNAYKCVDGIWTLEEKCINDAVCVEKTNLSAVCEVEPLAGDPLPPDIPTPEPIKPPEEDE